MLETNFLGISFLEWIGYAASVLVLLSLTMSSIIKLRWFNLVGAVLFSTYGFLIGSLPVGIMNFLIVMANIYNLKKLYSHKEDFKIVSIKGEDDLLNHFLSHYQKDIQKFFPNFKGIESKEKLCFLTLRNMAVSGIFVGSKTQEGSLQIDLDYALPEYRDFKVGDYLYHQLNHQLKKEGFRSIICPADLNFDYLQKMGFTPTQRNGVNVMEKQIS